MRIIDFIAYLIIAAILIVSIAHITPRPWVERVMAAVSVPVPGDHAKMMAEWEDLKKRAKQENTHP